MRRFAPLFVLFIALALTGCVPVFFQPIAPTQSQPTPVPTSESHPTDPPSHDTGVVSGILGVISIAAVLPIDDTHAEGQIEATDEQMTQFARLRGIDVANVIFDDYGYFIHITVDDAKAIIGDDVYQMLVDKVAEQGSYEIEWILAHTDPAPVAPVQGGDQAA